MTFSLVLVAAGKGKRLGGSVKKQFLSFRGHPLYQSSLRTFLKVRDITQIIVVCESEEIKRVREEINFSFPDHQILTVAGGKERYLSVFNGLKSMPIKTDFVLIHDSARPLISLEDILAIIKKAKEFGVAVLPCEKVKDTVKTIIGDHVADNLDRKTLAAASTPQCVLLDSILKGYEKCESLKRIPTDDVELISLVGGKIKVHWLNKPNPKITTPEDLVFLETI